MHARLHAHFVQNKGPGPRTFQAVRVVYVRPITFVRKGFVQGVLLRMNAATGMALYLSENTVCACRVINPNQP